MVLFSFPQDEVVTSFGFKKRRVAPGNAIQDARADSGGTSKLLLVSERSAAVDLSTQFIIFQLSNQAKGPAVVESSNVEPAIDGSEDEPDVLVALEMLSFHIGDNEEIAPDTRATMRINFGKDESSTEKRFDTVFWSIAAGLNLYDEAKKGEGGRAESKDLRTDFHKAFGNRPIEIPGGLGRLAFEVVKHKEPPWWKKVFRFFESGTGEKLISVLGFPAITTQAIDVIDGLLNRLDEDEEPEPLFKSIPMRLALSKYARDAFTGSNPRVKMGSLRQGFCIMARGRDFDRLNDADVVYYPTFGKLIPQKVTPEQLMTGDYDDPLNDVTYAVFRLGMKRAKLDPTFNYSS
jgi:hypothetical protein